MNKIGLVCLVVGFVVVALISGFIGYNIRLLVPYQSGFNVVVP